MLFIYLLFLFFAFGLCGVVIVFFAFQIMAMFTTDAPFVPIPGGIEEKIVETLKLNSESVVYDLGCGDARVLRKTAEKYPSIRAVGVEIGWFPYVLAKWKTRKNKNVEIRRENIFNTDVSDATHIFVYLFPHVMEKLIPILKKKCAPGTRIVSCDFGDKNRVPTEIIDLPDNSTKRGKRLVIYTI